MADWVVYDAGAAAETLPPSLSTVYAAWLTEEVRVQRLGLIVSGVVADFRKAVAADADATGRLDAESVPLSVLRHVSAVTWYMLAQEAGADAEPYRPAWLDSEIYLRRLYQDLEAGGGGAAGTPLYSPGAASGAAAGPDGRILRVPEYDAPGYISYATPAS